MDIPPRVAGWPRLEPAALKGLLATEAALSASGLGEPLLEMVKLRASQVNGCAYCIHLHATTWRKLGETEMRVYMLDGWRESPLYSPRERAALAWTEAVTRVIETHAPDEVYEELTAHFTPAECVHLTVAIGVINLWNRVQIALRVTHPFDDKTLHTA